MSEFSAQEIYEYLSNEWIKLEKKTVFNEEIIRKRKESNKQHMERISNPKIDTKLIEDIGAVDLKLIERSNLAQKYIGCLSLIITMIGIEGSDTAKNIKEGVERFYQEKKHIYRDMFEVDKQISKSLLEILEHVLRVE